MFTLFTFYPRPDDGELLASRSTTSRALKHACPPGPELRAKVTSTSSRGMDVLVNPASHCRAAVLSAAVGSDESEGGGIGLWLLCDALRRRYAD